jgi:hypothetical protein
MTEVYVGFVKHIFLVVCGQFVVYAIYHHEDTCSLAFTEWKPTASSTGYYEVVSLWCMVSLHQQPWRRHGLTVYSRLIPRGASWYRPNQIVFAAV